MAFSSPINRIEYAPRNRGYVGYPPQRSRAVSPSGVPDRVYAWARWSEKVSEAAGDLYDDYPDRDKALAALNFYPRLRRSCDGQRLQTHSLADPGLEEVHERDPTWYEALPGIENGSPRSRLAAYCQRWVYESQQYGEAQEELRLYAAEMEESVTCLAEMKTWCSSQSARIMDAIEVTEELEFYNTALHVHRTDVLTPKQHVTPYLAGTLPSSFESRIRLSLSRVAGGAVARFYPMESVSNPVTGETKTLSAFLIYSKHLSVVPSVVKKALEHFGAHFFHWPPDERVALAQIAAVRKRLRCVGDADEVRIALDAANERLQAECEHSHLLTEFVQGRSLAVLNSRNIYQREVLGLRQWGSQEVGESRFHGEVQNKKTLRLEGEIARFDELIMELKLANELRNDTVARLKHDLHARRVAKLCLRDVYRMICTRPLYLELARGHRKMRGEHRRVGEMEHHARKVMSSVYLRVLKTLRQHAVVDAREYVQTVIESRLIVALDEARTSLKEAAADGNIEKMKRAVEVAEKLNMDPHELVPYKKFLASAR